RESGRDERASRGAFRPDPRRTGARREAGPPGRARRWRRRRRARAGRAGARPRRFPRPSAGKRELERSGALDPPVLRRQPVKEVESGEVSGVELVVERMAEIVLDDRFGEARAGGFAGDQAREVPLTGFVRRAHELLRARLRNTRPNRPEREDERVTRKSAPLR